jgi:hypothetical protein
MTLAGITTRKHTAADAVTIVQALLRIIISVQATMEQRLGLPRGCCPRRLCGPWPGPPKAVRNRACRWQGVRTGLKPHRIGAAWPCGFSLPPAPSASLGKFGESVTAGHRPASLYLHAGMFAWPAGQAVTHPRVSR